MLIIALSLTTLGSFGAVFLWILGIRPYVCRGGKGYRTGANVLVAMWVDWQSCGEIAKERNQAVGWGLYWGYLGLHLASLIGLGILFFSGSLFG